MALGFKTRSRVADAVAGAVEQCPADLFTGKQTGPYSVISKPVKYELKGIQNTESEGHERGRDGHYHAGGPFNTYRYEWDIGSVPYNQSIPRNGAIQRHVGDVLIPWPTDLPAFAFSRYGKKNFKSLDASGATAIAQTAPTNSASHLAIALSELKKDGIPSIPGISTWKRRTELAQSAGDEFLNVEFGWLPLINDVLEIGGAARMSRDIVQQYQKDEGNNVRRDFTFPTERSNSTTILSEETYPIVSGSFGPNFYVKGEHAKLVREENYTNRKWFSGAYTYALPSRTDSFRKMLAYGSEADKLFGIAISPDVLWELAPWSWAIDWFTNAGDVIHNTTAFGLAGLVMRYGYMMEESSHQISHSLSKIALQGYSGQAAPSSTLITESKVRRPANPFGFGLTGVDLSPTQVAITIALGLSRL